MEYLNGAVMGQTLNTCSRFTGFRIKWLLLESMATRVRPV
ncbi:hypothetical protein FLA_0514 [Filimonas lacunae]|nr:hypothetical protein FLA_0514 [Filimonas lacunae]